jgi:hypothetical protein
MRHVLGALRLHARSEFIDYDDVGLHRHLLRSGTGLLPECYKIVMFVIHNAANCLHAACSGCGLRPSITSFAQCQQTQEDKHQRLLPEVLTITAAAAAAAAAFFCTGCGSHHQQSAHCHQCTLPIALL